MASTADAASATNRRTLYVNGLSPEVTEQLLSAAFIPFGPIEGVEIPIDYKTRTYLYRNYNQ